MSADDAAVQTDVAPATYEEWGVVIDDLGSTDMAESEEEARAWFANGDGLALVRVVVTEWPYPPAQQEASDD
jgi:hypothetical protein